MRVRFVAAAVASALVVGSAATAATSRQANPVARDSEADLALTRTLPTAFERVCDRQRSQAPARARSCPPLIPIGPLRVEYSGRSLGRESAGGGFSADLASRSTGRLGGRRFETNGGHWRYDVAWWPSVRRAIVRSLQRPVNAEEASACRNVRIDGHGMELCRVVPYERGGGLNGGHVSLRWDHGGVTFVISLHGYGNEPRARAMMAAFASEIARAG